MVGLECVGPDVAKRLRPLRTDLPALAIGDWMSLVNIRSLFGVFNAEGRQFTPRRKVAKIHTSQ